MAIWLTKDSKVIVQGMTGSEGSKHTRRMLAAGTNVVGGVNPRKAGQIVDFDGTQGAGVRQRRRGDGRDRRRRHRHLRAAAVHQGARCVEAIDAGIALAVVITEGMPVHDTAAFWALQRRPTGNATRIIGPNCPGIATPGRVQRRHHPGRHHRRRPHRPGQQVAAR